jgi:peptide/nickel transport system substrate-binding protein
MGLEEHELREWVQRVTRGEASRRQFMRTMLGLGLAGPVVADMLGAYAPAAAQDRRDVQPTFPPTTRGSGGKLRLLWYDAPVILNPHLASGAKDQEASGIVYEPLFSVNPNAEFIPILATEMPSLENGDRAPDGTWTIWRLKQGVVWHDGAPFTADDVVFTWEYATDPTTGATTRGIYEPIRRIDKLDDHAIKVVFTEPTPLWYFVAGSILPKHRFAEYKGARAREAPYNLRPVGTGPLQDRRLQTRGCGALRYQSALSRPQPPFL